jgi:hypothetical protein
MKMTDLQLFVAFIVLGAAYLGIDVLNRVVPAIVANPIPTTFVAGCAGSVFTLFIQRLSGGGTSPDSPPASAGGSLAASGGASGEAKS